MKHYKYIISACTLLMGASLHIDAEVARIAPRTRIEARHAAADSIVSAYIGIDAQLLDRDALARAGATVTVESGDLLTARFPHSALAAVAEVPGVKYIQTAGRVLQMLDVARTETGANRVYAGSDLTQGYTGKGVVVGVVDCGFDYNHPAFVDPDGKLRISRVWEQSTSIGTPPDKFGYGTELTDAESIHQAEGDIRNNSHGTHVAAIAAGSDHIESDRFIGMAPDAEIVLVSFKSDEDASVNVSNAIAYIFDYAESQGKPCVINLSLGTQDGPHDGTSPFDRIADSLQGPGRIIVGSAGNHRTNKFHAQGSSTFKSFIDFRQSITTANAGGNIDVWSDEGQDIEVSILVYNVNTGVEAERIKVYPSDETEVSLGRNVSGKVDVASERNPANNKVHVSMTSGITSVRSNYAVALEVAPVTPGNMHVWADNIKLGLTSRGLEGFTDGDASTIVEIGGTGKRIISVGAYTTRNAYTPFNASTEQKLDETIGALSSFSSCGPTADGRVKPLVSAPGCYISSAISSFDLSGSSPVSYAYEIDGNYVRYGYMEGTSMSSPAVAGIVATWLQACPTLTPEQIAEVIKHTSRTDEFTGEIPAEGSNDWGYGKIDAYAGLKECLTMSSVTALPIEDVSSIHFQSEGNMMKVLFGANHSNATIDIYTASAVKVMSRSLTDITPGTDATIDLSHLSKGVYILSVRTDSAVKTIKFSK